MKNVRKELTYEKIKHNTYKTVQKTLTKQQIVQNLFKTVRDALKYQKHTKYIQNGAQSTNIATNPTKHKNSAKRTNIPNT